MDYNVFIKKDLNDVQQSYVCLLLLKYKNEFDSITKKDKIFLLNKYDSLISLNNNFFDNVLEEKNNFQELVAEFYHKNNMIYEELKFLSENNMNLNSIKNSLKYMDEGILNNIFSRFNLENLYFEQSDQLCSLIGDNIVTKINNRVQDGDILFKHLVSIGIYKDVLSNNFRTDYNNLYNYLLEN